MQQSSLTHTAVALIKDTFPWLWAMKELLDMHPNFIPVGVGHSQAPIDMSEWVHSLSADFDGGYAGHVDTELELEHGQSEGAIEEVADHESTRATHHSCRGGIVISNGTT